MPNESIAFKPRHGVDAAPRIQPPRCSSAADLQRNFAANALQILLLAKRKPEGFRRKMGRFAANFLQMQRGSLIPLGFRRVFAAPGGFWQRTGPGAITPAGPPQQG